MSKVLIGLLSLLTLLCTACGQAGSDKAEATHHHPEAVATGHEHNIQKRELVPSDEGCMVNDTYMRKMQFDVEFHGNTYDGR